MKMLLGIGLILLGELLANQIEGSHVCIDPVTALTVFAFMMRDYIHAKKDREDRKGDKEK